MSSPLIILCNQTEKFDAAKSLAKLCHAEVFCDCSPENFSAESLAVVYSDAGVVLQRCGEKAPGPVFVDLIGGKLGYRRRQSSDSKSDIAKAVGFKKSKPPTVLDVTAGLGHDGFVLAHLGCEVTLLERNPIVYALLSDGITRAKQHAALDDQLLLQTLSRMKIVNGDAIRFLSELPAEADEQPDVIYIDPMFPERNKTAKVKLAMQVFHEVVGGDTDADQLLKHALARAKYRVVVKRPLKAEFLAGHLPATQIKGRAVRFDVYALRKMP